MPQSQKLRAQTSIVLASTSPRRKEILSRLGLPFEIVAPDYEEKPDAARSADEEVLFFSKEKALSVAKNRDNTIVIGSDTMIAYHGKKIGKPKNAAHAKVILKKLQGRSHVILTGLFIVDTGNQVTQSTIEKVEVTFYPMSDTDIDDYIQTGEPLDKAGAYAVQGIGAKFIQTLKGDRLAAMGLPLAPIRDFLRARQLL